MKKRMKKVATLCLAGVTAMSTVGVTGSAVFAKGDTNYDVDNMDFENVELRVAFRFNNGSDTDGQAKWYYKALDEFNKENEGKIHVTDESISTESDYEEKLTTDFASGNVPNAFLQYGGSRTRDYVDAGYILDLTPYFEQYPEWKEGVQDFAWETTQFDGIEASSLSCEQYLEKVTGVSFKELMADFYTAVAAGESSGKYSFYGDTIAAAKAATFPVYAGDSNENHTLPAASAILVKLSNGKFTVPTDGSAGIVYRIIGS